MPLIEIRHRWNRRVLFTLESGSLKLALEAAVGTKATLGGATLRGATLRGATLGGATLDGATLRGATLREADLRGVDLDGADLVALQRTSIVPEVGAFEAYKRCRNGVIVHLRIPAEAARSSASGRKCRAQSVDVLTVYGADEGLSVHDGTTVYRVGHRVACHRWESNRWVECGGGIHFYLSRIEAEAN